MLKHLLLFVYRKPVIHAGVQTIKPQPQCFALAAKNQTYRQVQMVNSK